MTVAEKILSVLRADIIDRGGIVDGPEWSVLESNVRALADSYAVEGTETDTGDDLDTGEPFYADGHVHVLPLS